MAQLAAERRVPRSGFFLLPIRRELAAAAICAAAAGARAGVG